MCSPQVHFYGYSNHNQKIESWWGFIRKQCSQFWMNVFQSLKDTGTFTGDCLDINVLQFCFMQMIQVRTSDSFTRPYTPLTNGHYEKCMYMLCKYICRETNRCKRFLNYCGLQLHILFSPKEIHTSNYDGRQRPGTCHCFYNQKCTMVHFFVVHF